MKNWFRNNRGFLLFIVLFGTFRMAVADWNPVPTGSMRPNILEGDVVLINRLAFDLKLPLTDVVLAHLGKPKRGEIVTFSSPKDGTRLIKRVIALPGDEVVMRDGVLSINGKRAEYSDPQVVLEMVAPQLELQAVRVNEGMGKERHRIQLLPDVDTSRNYGPVTVPKDHYLMLGDNRDNSIDSRAIGLVPREAIIGRAERVLVSADIKESWLPRWSRWGMRLE